MAEISSISINTQSAQQSIADLERELQETNEQLKQVDINSEAFADLQKKAASAKGQLDQINKTTDALSKGFQGFGENLAKVTGGISGGIAAATAAMQLMGVENENIVAGIAKLQQLMAFTQGISSLKDLGEGFKNLKGVVGTVTKSFNGLKGAIIGTGIGALVVALGLLIANFDKIDEKVKELTGGLGVMDTIVNSVKAGWEGLKQAGVALVDTFEQLLKPIQNIGNALVTYIKTPFQTIFNTISAFISTDGGLVNKLKAAATAAKETVVENFSDIGDQLEQAVNTEIDTSEWKKVGKKAGEKFQEGVAEANEKSQQENAKPQQEQQVKDWYKDAELRLQIEEEKNKRLELSDEERLQKEIDLENRRLELIKKKYGEQSLEYEKQYTVVYNLQKQLNNLGKDSGETSTETPEEDPIIQQLKDRAQTYRDSLITQEEKLAQEKALNQKYYDEGLIQFADYQANLTAIESQEDEIRSNKKIAIIKGTLATIQAAATLTTDILGDVIDKQDTTTKEGFEKSKKLQIAQATINMLTGVATALAGIFTTKSGPWDIALAAIQAASIAAAGIANINKIKATKFDSTSTPSVSTNVSSTTITPPTQYTQAVQSANLESKLTDTKVYVLESDIAKTTNKVSVQESENTY